MSKPKGILVAIGGAEDKEDDMKVLRHVLDLTRAKAERVAILPTASRIPREAAEPYLDAFDALGVETSVIDVRDRAEADDPDHLRAVRDADVVYFTGGDQLRLTSVLGGSPLLEAIRDKYLEGCVVAGTSAGAAAMSATMIFQGAATDGGMRKGNVQMTPGLGFLPHAVVDTHFVNRGRFSRLLEVITSTPRLLGIGIGEDTAIVVRHGTELEVVGRGLVVIVDGQEIHHTNIADIATGDPISAERLVVHTLGDGYGFDLRDRAYVPARRKGREVRA